MTITVNVMQHHIEKGEPKDCMKCPIALAIQDQNPQLDLNDITIDLPEKAIYFIDDFDNNKKVYPISFKLEI